MAAPPARRAFAGLDRIKWEGLRMRLIDAEGQVVGRLAAQLALVLQGKDKPTFAPNEDGGDVCVVVNADKIVFTGRKWELKKYQWHTGYPGGLREMVARELWRRDPSEVLKRAVEGMLPKNNLQRDRMRKLRVFSGPAHPFGDAGGVAAPWAPPPKQLEDHRMAWAMPQGFAPMNPDAYSRRMRGARRVAGGGAGGEDGGAGGGGGGEAGCGEASSSHGAGSGDGSGAGDDAVAQLQAVGWPPGGQQRQQQHQPARHAAPDLDFSDLLAVDEREFIEQCRQRGSSGTARRGA